MIRTTLQAIPLALAGSALAAACHLAGWHLASLLAQIFFPTAVVRL